MNHTEIDEAAFPCGFDDLFILKIYLQYVPKTPFGILCVCEEDGEMKALVMFAHHSFLCRGEMVVFSCYGIKTSTLVIKQIFLWKCVRLLRMAYNVLLCVSLSVFCIL